MSKAIVLIFLLWSVLGFIMKKTLDNENRIHGITLPAKKKILSIVLAGPVFWVVMSLLMVFWGIYAILFEIYRSIMDYFTTGPGEID